MKKYKTSQKQRGYALRYYNANKEAIMEQQSDRRKEKSVGDRRKLENDRPPWQGIAKRDFCVRDLSQASGAKFERRLQLILDGQMGLIP